MFHMQYIFVLKKKRIECVAIYKVTFIFLFTRVLQLHGVEKNKTENFYDKKWKKKH